VTPKNDPLLAVQRYGLGRTAAFTSDQEFGSWLAGYYRHPDAGKIPAALRYYCDTPLFDNVNNRMPIASFFAALFRTDAVLTEKVYRGIDAGGSDNEKVFMSHILWLADTAKSRQLLGQIDGAWKSEAVQQIRERMRGKAPRDVMTASVEDPSHVDKLWLTFFATGDGSLVRKVISLLHLQQEGQGLQVMLGGAARSSLTSNAYQHEKVFQICREELKRSKGATRESLEQVIQDVERQKEAEKNRKKQ